MTEDTRKPRMVTPRGWSSLAVSGAALSLAMTGSAFAFPVMPRMAHDGAKAPVSSIWLASAKTARSEGGEGG